MSIRPVLGTSAVIFIACVLSGPVAAQGTWADRLKGAAPPAPAATEAGPTDPATSTVPAEAEYDTMVGALKDALEVGSGHAVAAAGKTDGFMGNPAIRIPMPGFLEDASSMLRGTGLGPQADALEKGMNRAAEQASAKAGGIMAEAISRLVIDDPRAVLIGAPDGATRLLRRRAGERLFDDLRPLVEASMTQTDASAAFADLNKQIAQRLPALGTLEDMDLTDYVTVKTLDGLFLLLAEEEKKIRLTPEARTTDLLREVFGG